MSGADGMRRCAECDRDVYDLSALSATEAESLLDGRNGERICITFRRGPDGQVITRDRPARFVLRRLAGASGIAAATALTLTLAPDVSAARSAIAPAYQQPSTKPASKQLVAPLGN
jgi:hypothetical protein